MIKTPTMHRVSLLPRALCAAGLLVSGSVTAQTYSKTEVIGYHDNTAKWVLGQTASVTCAASTPVDASCNGDVVSTRTYDSGTALPLTTSRFGKLQQTLTYNSDGTVQGVSDGRDSVSVNTTVTLSNWKRGIPQTITFPDTGTGAKSKTAVVDNLGQILSVTDETGAKTCYGYDPMGRINRITYPSESQSGVCADYNASSNPNGWNPTILNFAAATAAKYGLPIGHWQQTTTTGNGVKITYYDALWRPLVSEGYDAANPTATRTVSVTRYDGNGHPVYQSYPLASLTSYATVTQGTRTYYDALSRSTKVEQDSELGQLTTTMAYLSGFKTQVTSPRHQGAVPAITTTTDYKTYDQPTTDWPVAIAHPEGAFTDIVRDAFGKPTLLKRRNSTGSIALSRTYAYFDTQELCRREEPETGATLMGYDAAGNLAWSATGLPVGTACNNAGDTAAILANKVASSYDQRNRVVSVVFPIEGLGNTSQTYTADGLPNTIAVDNGGGNVTTTTYGYDKRRLLTSEQLSSG